MLYLEVGNRQYRLSGTDPMPCFFALASRQYNVGLMYTIDIEENSKRAERKEIVYSKHTSISLMIRNQVLNLQHVFAMPAGYVAINPYNMSILTIIFPDYIFIT